MLVDDEGYAATLDITQGMRHAKLIPPVSILPYFDYNPKDHRSSRVPTFIAGDGTTALGGGYLGFFDDDADDDDHDPQQPDSPEFRPYFLFNSTPGALTGAEPYQSVLGTFVGNFTLPPIRIRDGQYLLAVSLTENAVNTHLIVATIGIVSTASLPRPIGLRWDDSEDTAAKENLQLCALPSGFKSDAVLFIRGRAHTVVVQNAGGNPPTLAIQSDGRPTGVAQALCGQRDGAFLGMVVGQSSRLILLDEVYM